jgi:hypothetical protein
MVPRNAALPTADASAAIPDLSSRAGILSWRKAQRNHLIAERLAINGVDRRRNAAQIALHLTKLVDSLPGRSVSFYWPFRDVPDLRPFMQTLWDRGEAAHFLSLSRRMRHSFFVCGSLGASSCRASGTSRCPPIAPKLNRTSSSRRSSVSTAPAIGSDMAAASSIVRSRNSPRVLSPLAWDMRRLLSPPYIPCHMTSRWTSLLPSMAFTKYEGLQPVYSEYNIGPFRRSFRISNRIDQDRIKAEMRDGVITLTLPKAEEAKPRRIEVRSGPVRL